MKRLALTLVAIMFSIGAISALPAHIYAGSKDPNDQTEFSSNSRSLINEKTESAGNVAVGDEGRSLKTDKKTDLHEPGGRDKSSSAVSFGGSFRVRTGWTGSN